MKISADKLRRIALEHQGLLRRAPFGRGKAATQRAIEQIGYVQIDTISVVSRAHNHVLSSRVPGFQEAHLDALLSQGQIFEYWYHAAAYLPMRDYRFALPKMHAMASGQDRWIRSRDRTLMRDVLARIRSEGPLRARDFEADKNHPGGWWNWKPAKQALEQLFMQGDLMVVSREGFQKVYDLTERVLPSAIDTRTPDTRELAAHLLHNTLRSHGFTAARTVTHLRRGAELRQALKELLREAEASERLVQFCLPGGEIAYADPEVLESRAPIAANRVKILSPFDNAVIQRDRVLKVFDYDYQIECYVPEEKRRFGYFCLPLLYADRFVGRVDCKAHRREARFEVKALYLEDKKLQRQPPVEFVNALATALREFAIFNGCEQIEITRTSPPGCKSQLVAAIEAGS